MKNSVRRLETLERFETTPTQRSHVRQFLATLSDSDVDILADVAEAQKAGWNLDTLLPDTLARYDDLIAEYAQ
jgi:hypothetical protein